jgi:hypothetical protein
MIPTGPSPRSKGRRTSSSKAIIINGKQNAKVFPDPVKAIPIMSRPEKLMQEKHDSDCEDTRLLILLTLSVFLEFEWGWDRRYRYS